jgi:hypothetical protein
MFPAVLRWAIVVVLAKPLLPDRLAHGTWLSRGSVAAMCCVAALGLPFVLSQGHTGVVRQTVIRPEPDVPAPTNAVLPTETQSSPVPVTSIADSTTTIAQPVPTTVSPPEPATTPASPTTLAPKPRKPSQRYPVGVTTTTTPEAESSPPEPPPSVPETTPTIPDTSPPPPTEPVTTTTQPPPPTTEPPPTTIVTEPTTTSIPKECKKHCH